MSLRLDRLRIIACATDIKSSKIKVNILSRRIIGIAITSIWESALFNYDPIRVPVPVSPPLDALFGKVGQFDRPTA